MLASTNDYTLKLKKHANLLALKLTASCSETLKKINNYLKDALSLTYDIYEEEKNAQEYNALPTQLMLKEKPPYPSPISKSLNKKISHRLNSIRFYLYIYLFL